MGNRAAQFEWDETWRVFTDLWPSAKDMTDAQAGEWEARLRYRNQDQVRGAIRNVYSKVKFPRNPPALDAVMNECNYLHRSAQISQQMPISTTTDDNWDEIQREADLVRPILKSLPPAELERHKKTACNVMALLRGFNCPLGDKHAIKQQEQVVKDTMKSSTNDPTKWSGVFVLCVNAAMERSGLLKRESSQPECGRDGAAQKVSTVPPTPDDFDESSIPF